MFIQPLELLLLLIYLITIVSYHHVCCLWFLVDPVELRALVLLELLRLEPQGNLLLSTLNTIGAVAHISANIDGVVTSDGTRGRGKRIGGTKDGWRVLAAAGESECGHLHRPVLQASRPCQTMATIGPLSMSVRC
jgi:hypothetical protein